MLFSRDSAGASGCLSVLSGRAGRCSGFVVGGFVILMTGYQSSAQVQFTDVSASSGVDFVSHFATNSAGVIAADITGDGYPELFFNDTAGYHNALYLNNRDGTFTEVGTTWGVRSPNATKAGLFVDWDHDGLLDLVTSHRVSSGLTMVQILRNTGHHFESFGRARMTPIHARLGGQMTAFDYDGDGFIDLATTGGPCEGLDDQNYILRNDQSGSFEVLRPFISQQPGCAPWQSVAADIDGNGLIDLFGAQDFFNVSHLYLHHMDGSMVDVGIDMGINAGPDMGVAIADYDNDGDQDIYTTDITQRPPGNNQLLQNQLSETGTLGLIEIANQVGVGNSGVGWGASFFDYDNDGYLDLVVASSNERSRIFHNHGDGTFEDLGESIGFAPEGAAQGIIAVDYDMDGDLDIVIANKSGPAQVYRNDGGNSAGSWIKIRLIDNASPNHFAVGSKVTIQAGDQTLFHQTKTGVSFHSQEPYLLHFGLGANVGQCDIAVEWPDGRVSTIINAASDQVLSIVRPAVQVRH